MQTTKNNTAKQLSPAPGIFFTGDRVKLTDGRPGRVNFSGEDSFKRGVMEYWIDLDDGGSVEVGPEALVLVQRCPEARKADLKRSKTAEDFINLLNGEGGIIEELHTYIYFVKQHREAIASGAMTFAQAAMHFALKMGIQPSRAEGMVALENIDRLLATAPTELITPGAAAEIWERATAPAALKKAKAWIDELEEGCSGEDHQNHLKKRKPTSGEKLAEVLEAFKRPEMFASETFVQHAGDIEIAFGDAVNLSLSEFTVLLLHHLGGAQVAQLTAVLGQLPAVNVSAAALAEAQAYHDNMMKECREEGCAEDYNPYRMPNERPVLGETLASLKLALINPATRGRATVGELSFDFENGQRVTLQDILSLVAQVQAEGHDILRVQPVATVPKAAPRPRTRSTTSINRAPSGAGSGTLIPHTGRGAQAV